MTFDLPTPEQVIVIPPSDTVVVSELYTVTATASPEAAAVAVTVACDHGFDLAGDYRQMGDVSVFVNGFLRVGSWGGPYPPHTFQANYDGRRATFAFTIDRAACPDLAAAGPCLVSVKVGTNDPAQYPVICYAALRPTLPARPVSSLAGTVLRSLFWSPELAEFAADPTLLPAVKAAGVNCLMWAALHNPADSLPESATPADIQAATLDRNYFDAAYRPYYQFARDNGLKLLIAGDDLCRNAREQAWITTAPSAHDDVVWVAQQLAQYADVIAGIELVDEGGNPADSQAYQNAINWLREGWPGVKIAVPNQFAQAWDSGPWVDYQSRFWATDGVGFETTPSLGEISDGLARAATGVNRDRPFLCQVSAAGPYYTKLAAGDDYQPGLDKLQRGGLRALTIPAQAWVALANGACGLRTYAFDFKVARDRRSQSPVGTANLETGVRPGDDRWPGLAAAYSSVESREAKLLSGFRPPVLDGSLYWGFRDGLTWAVNVGEVAADLPQGGGSLVTPAGESEFAGGPVPPGGVVVWG